MGWDQVTVLQFWLSTSFVLLSGRFCIHVEASRSALGACDLDVSVSVVYITAWK